MTQPASNEILENDKHTMFQVLKSADTGAARLGRLAIANRRVMQTPNYIAIASRGAVPHLTPDNVTKHTGFDAAYMAIEDYLEKEKPPILAMPVGSRNLHKFTALSPERATILGARRFPSVASPVGNGPHHLSIFTSTGFRNMTMAEFASTIEALQPDITIPPAELFPVDDTPSRKRKLRAVDRTEDWIDDFFKHLKPEGKLKELGVSVFAPILTVDHPLQWEYLRHLSEDLADALAGLAIYNTNLLPDLESYPSFGPLPKLSLHAPKSPQEVLRQVALGIDICTIPFINSISDAGVALSFTFPPPEADQVRPLGIDMWAPEHTTAVVPLAQGCKCYTCTNHHRAFLKHLLNAKEMLGWSLLQMHNHAVMTDFFAGIRQVLSEGGNKFEEYSRRFSAVYEPELPKGTGERPRARGYHFKSLANATRLNQPSWQAFDDDDQSPSPAEQGKETPLIPDGDSKTLANKGFAQVQDQRKKV